MGNAKRRVSAKRKRQFRGNGSTIKHSKNSSATSTNASSSKIKIPAVFDEEIAEYQRKPLTGNRIIDMEVLLNLFLQLCCPRCFEEGILLSEDSTYVDGTWQRRGYCSMNGCVAALSADTGKVVDIEIMSSYCNTCRKISKIPRSIESKTFAADHVCHSNFQGSALKMEAVGATRIFQRSIVKRGLKYAHYYGKLTNSFIDRLQNYYGIAVRSNVGNLSGLQQNVIAALFHCSSSVEKPMHGQCPIGKDSWCYYQRALSCGKKPKEKYKGLSNEGLNMIKPTYLELCTKELLTKCLYGKTQNSNECLNGVIWQRVPKEVFVCLKTLKYGALDAVIQFNDGYKGCVEIFKKLNITPGYFTLKSYKHLDINRINDAERHSTPNVKQRRKILRATRKKINVLESKEGVIYKSGAF
ncbi:uncharacterized protein TNCV_2018771 [Trichonephila clavipes]|nr:uncharacterized protein TNCV_2018771 [Trichonephila clavipes]